MKKIIQAPAKGQVITAQFLGEVAGAINSGIQGPEQEQRGLEDGITPTQTQKWVGVSYETTTVRVSDPEDEDVFVDVERFTSITFRTPHGFVELVIPDIDA